MLFADVRKSLTAVLRGRVRNGELTERGLARLVGVSQPHIHNVLKGVRSLSPELSDQILQHLRLSLLDLIERERMEAHLSFIHQGGYVYVPLLAGRIGPGCAWPTTVSSDERLPFPEQHACSILNPVAARLGEDARMLNVFSTGDIALLDQGLRARTDIEHGAYYVVKYGKIGMIRLVEMHRGALYLIADDARHRPLAWQRVRLDGRPVTQVVRARAHLVNPVCEWI
jgi:transcriptional regulator with XRE-family HTH domain